MSTPNPVLDTHTDPITQSTVQTPQSYKYYHAGPLFSLGDLAINARLGKAIEIASGQKYQPILPQDLEQRDTSPHSIRDHDIKALLSCDLALFTYDGTELDSGTVVEYMVAKFADVPCVILRSDFRGGGDQGAHGGDPWNLMSSFWPRSVGVVVDGMMEYKTALKIALKDESSATETASGLHDVSVRAGELVCKTTAEKVVAGFDQVVLMKPRLPKELRGVVYQWLSLMPNFKDGTDEENLKEMAQLLRQKEEKGLL